MTVIKNETPPPLNVHDKCILILVEVDGGGHVYRYVRCSPFREPAFPEASVNFDLKRLLALSEDPS